MNSKNTSASCRTAHHHHYYHVPHHHHHHRIEVAARNCSEITGDYGYAGGAVNPSCANNRMLMNRTMDSLNYWKRAFANPEQMSILGERFIRLGGSSARSSSALSGTVNNNSAINGSDCIFGTKGPLNSKERKASSSKVSCKCIRTSTSAAKLPMVKTLSPIRNSPQFLESPIAAMVRKSSDVERNVGFGFSSDENFSTIHDHYSKAINRYTYGIDDLTDTDDTTPQSFVGHRLNTQTAIAPNECLDSELETDEPMGKVRNADKKERKVTSKRKTDFPHSQLETSTTKKTAENKSKIGVIGIAKYHEGADYAMPLIMNDTNIDHFKPTVMNYNHDDHSISKNRKPIGKNINNVDSFNLKQNDFHNIYYDNYISVVNKEEMWNHQHINNNDNGGKISQNRGSVKATSACGSAANSASKTTPSTGIYDDEDGTLVFAIEI